MTDRLTHLRELEKAASLPPWDTGRGPEFGTDRRRLMASGEPLICGTAGEGPYRMVHHQDATLVAEARNLLPALLDLWSAARRQKWTAHIDPVKDGQTVYCAQCQLRRALAALDATGEEA